LTNSTYAGKEASVRDEQTAVQSGTSKTALWRKKIAAAKADTRQEEWRKQASMSLAAYENGEIEGTQITGANLLHANIETVVPSIYNSTPVPDIRVRHGEEDRIAKIACDMQERIVGYDLDGCRFDDVMFDLVRKALIVGEGIPRIRWEPTFGEKPLTSDDGQPILDEAGQPIVQSFIERDKVYPEVVPWDRIIFGPCRTFEKCPWIVFDHDMTHEEVVALSGEEIAEQITFGNTDKAYRKRVETDASEPENEETGIFDTAKVYEIWDKASGSVFWITDKEQEPVLKSMRDPLMLEGFFPLPHALRPLNRQDRMRPVVQYALHKSLFDEFERITSRINALVKQLRVRGLYDAKSAPDFKKLQDCLDGEYVPADTGEVFDASTGKKGLADAVLHWPNEHIVMVVKELIQHRDIVKQLIWEATGVAEVMRGDASDQKTLGQVELEAKAGSMRIRKFQSEAARVARDIIRMMLEVRANMSPWDWLKDISSMPFTPTQDDINAAMQQVQAKYQQAMQGGMMMAQPPSPQMMQAEAQQMAIAAKKQEEEAVQAIIKSPARKLVIDIETDSTVRADMSKDMDQFNQLLTATGTWAQATMAVVQVLPETREAWFELLASQLSKFRLGKMGEDAVWKLVEASKSQPVLDNQPQQDPAAMEAEAQENDKQRQHEQGMQQAKMQQVQAKSQGDLAKIQAQTEADAAQVDISAQQSEVDNASADQQLQRDAFLAKLQAQLGIQSDVNKQQGQMQQAKFKASQRPMNGGFPQ
jgi:hypothetical protein